MTENQAQILAKLIEANTCGEFWTVAAVGATPGSHHTVTCARMLPLGWVERSNVGQGQDRPRWGYRVTAKGRQAHANHTATKRPA